jgi:hypothetical protein
MLQKILATFKTKTALAAGGYAIYHLGMYLQGVIELDVFLDKAWLAVMVVFGRAGIAKLAPAKKAGGKK